MQYQAEEKWTFTISSSQKKYQGFWNTKEAEVNPQITPENIRQPHISYPYNPLIANVLYSTTYIENWGSGVKRIMEACQKRGVAAPIWSINGGFVVVTFMRPAKGVTQGVTQDVTQGVTQEDTLDEKIEKAIKENLNVTTEDLAKQFGVTSMTIKRHLAKMPHIRYVGSGYSGHWEIVELRDGSLIR